MKHLFFLFILGWHAAAAQHVGLDNNEVTWLREWLKKRDADRSLLTLYAHQREVADRAMTEGPHPIDTIRSEGLLQGDPKKTGTQEALKDMGKIYALALVYKVDGNVAYLRVLERYL